MKTKKMSFLPVVLLTAAFCSCIFLNGITAMLFSTVFVFLTYFSFSTQIKIKNVGMLFIAVLVVLLNFVSLLYNNCPNVSYYFFICFVLYVGFLYIYGWRCDFPFRECFEYSVILTVLLLDTVQCAEMVVNGFDRGFSNTVGSSLNTVAALNLVVFPALLKIALFGTKKAVVRGAVLAAVLGGIVIVLSGSRSGYLLLALDLVVLFLFSSRVNKKTRKKLVIFAVLAVLLFFILFTNEALIEKTGMKRIMDMFDSDAVFEDEFRESLANQAKNVIDDNLWVGIGTTKIVSTWTGKAMSTQPHNFFYEIMLHSGILGFVAFCIYWLAMLRCFVKGKKKNKLYILMTLVNAVAMGLSHPVFTSSLLFSILFFNCFMFLAKDEAVGRERGEYV